MREIYKQSFNVHALELEAEFYAGGDGKVLSAGVDPAGHLSVWFVAPTPAERTLVKVTWVGTGIQYDPEKIGEYVGTAAFGPMILHAFATPI